MLPEILGTVITVGAVSKLLVSRLLRKTEVLIKQALIPTIIFKHVFLIIRWDREKLNKT